MVSVAEQNLKFFFYGRVIGIDSNVVESILAQQSYKFCIIIGMIISNGKVVSMPSAFVAAKAA